MSDERRNSWRRRLLLDMGAVNCRRAALSLILALILIKALIGQDIRPVHVFHALDFDYGSEALPGEVLAMKNAIKRYEVKSFRLAEAFSNNANPYIYQRAIEFLYPVRLAEDASMLFAPAGEILTSCEPLEDNGQISIWHCL